MPANSRCILLCAFALAVPTILAVASAATTAPALDNRATIDFDRHVRPILAENCFKCHGPDAGARMAGLRLDLPDGVLKRLVSGKTPIVPGNPSASELAARITSTGPKQMPPPSS